MICQCLLKMCEKDVFTQAERFISLVVLSGTLKSVTARCPLEPVQDDR